MPRFYLVQGVREDDYLLGNRVILAENWKDALNRPEFACLKTSVPIPEEIEDVWYPDIEGLVMFKDMWITVLDVEDLQGKFFRALGVDGKGNLLDWDDPQELLRVHNFLYPFLTYAISKKG